MSRRNLTSIALCLVLVTAVSSLSGCSRSPGNHTAAGSATAENPGSGQARGTSGVPIDSASRVIKAPVVISATQMWKKYGWNGFGILTKADDSATVSRVRNGDRVALEFHRMYIGNMLMDGTFFFDDSTLHLLEGRAKFVGSWGPTRADINAMLTNPTTMSVPSIYPDVYRGKK